MNFLFKNRVILLLGLLMIDSSIAANIAPPASPPAVPPSTTQPSLIDYCPAVDQLIKSKKGMIWSAPHGWQSYDESFIQQVDRFTGAQWVGIRVGKVTCLYKGKEAFTFPIALERDKLIMPPEGATWVKEIDSHGKPKDDQLICQSDQVTDCPFVLSKVEVESGSGSGSGSTDIKYQPYPSSDEILQ